MTSFFKSIEEAKDDELSADKEIKTRGTKRKLDEETRIAFHIDNDDVDLNEENNTNINTNNNNNNTNESSGDDSYYQWKRKRRKIDNDTRQSVNAEPLFDLNSDNANDIPYEPANDTWNAPEIDMARLTVTPPVERKKSPARSDGDHVTGGGERSIRRIDFAALRKEKEREARAAAKLKASGEQPRPASLRGSSGGGPNTSLKGNNDEPAPRQTIVREYKRPGIARSGSSSGMTRVNSPPPPTYHPPASSPKKKKQLQTLTTDNFFDTTPSVFVPKKPTANPPKEPAPLKTSGPKRPAAPAAPKKNSGNVLDSILNSMSK